MDWRMSTCLSRDNDLIVKDFATPEEWREWLYRNYPDIINTPRQGFTADGPVFKQYGTGYRWSSLEKKVGRG